MTREHKLALIIGFSLILVVGVLLSDHFSRARQSRLAQVQQEEPRVADAAPAMVLKPTREQPRVVIPETNAGLRQLAESRRPDPEPLPEPVSIDLGSLSLAASEGFTEPGSLPSDETVVLASGDGERSIIERVRDAGAAIFEENGRTKFDLPIAAEPRLEAMRRGPGQLDLASNYPPLITAPEAPPTVGAAQTWHDVRQGESLYQIAKRYYGDGNKWKKIADANKGKVGSDGTVRSGVRLVIPDVRTSTPAEKPATPAPTRVASASKPDPKAATTRTPAKSTGKTAPEKKVASATYTVKKGDTLGHIAQRTLGSSRRMQEIIELNRDKIDDENQLAAGMVLKLPPA